MKLSEVIKAIEDGSKNKFVNTIFSCKKSQRYEGVCFEVLTIAPENVVPLDGWEEIKPPRQWSEKELMLFKLLPDWAKWISKDRHGVYLSQNEPVKLEQQKTFINIEGGMCHSIELFDFLTITFEESPVYIGDLKGE